MKKKGEKINKMNIREVAERINEETNGNIKYKEKKWYIYNEENGIYEKKHKYTIYKYIRETVEKIEVREEWMRKMKNIRYTETVVNELKRTCKTIEEFDANPYTIGFPNGVLELITKEFRKGRREEYISMKSKNPYTPEEDTTLAREVLSDMFPKEEERKYNIDLLSLSITGENKGIITICCGYGGNGKSFIMERISSALGEYGDTLSATQLKKRGKLKGNIAKRNKKMLYCGELDKGDKINIKLMKEITGEASRIGSLTEREEGGERVIKPTYNIYICCNTFPKTRGMDEEMGRRIKIIDFPITFKEQPKRRNERKLKYFSESEEEEIEKGIMKVLIDNYFKLQEKGFKIKEPKRIETIKRIYTEEALGIER
jgi:phage/plasmid-associated DNA primase